MRFWWRQERSRVRDSVAESRLIDQRYRVIGVLMCVLLLALAWRFANLQIFDHALYAGRAESNRVSLRALPPTRGLIFDHRGQVLAENRPAYRLVIVPERVPDLEATLQAIADLVPVSDNERARFERQRQRSRRFQAIPLKGNLDAESVARLAAHRHQLAGVEVEPYLIRHYPHGELFAHVLGYVGRIDPSDLGELGAERYRATTHVGRTGLEQTYESLLHGEPGVEKVETNAQGRVVRVLERQDPIDGQDLTVSLDLELQRAAVDALGDQAGAIVVLDVETGAVRALVSQPGFDPNWFVNGISETNYQALLSCFAVVAFAFAHIAGHVDVGQEVHFYPNHAVALTGFAAAAFDVEGEAPRVVATRACFRRAGKQITNRREQAGVGRGVRARCASDRALINRHDFVEVFKPKDFFVRGSIGLCAIELLRRCRIERVVDQCGLTGTRDTSEAGHQTQRHINVEFF